MLINKKYDIFISYRHNNMTLVGELVHRLERYYDVFWDQRLESGYWSEQLTKAIDNSRAVLINLTLNSLNKNQSGEDWFYKEIVYSMENKSKEEIIPVCYDGFLFPADLSLEGATAEEKEKIEILRDNHQRITDLKSLDEIIEKIITYLSAIGIEPKEEFSRSKKEYSLKFETLSPVQSFVGRKSELSDIVKLLDENDIVFLSGMGGIGKTELAKKFMEEMTGGYRCIFCKYENSLKNTLSKIEIIGLDTEDFNVKERVLQKLLSKNVILVIDNFDFGADTNVDSYIYEFCKYSCKKLITTRNSFSESEFPCKTGFVSLGALDSSELKILFEKKYGKEITDSQFERILSFTGGLTIAVPILASLCLKSDITIDELCKKLENGIKDLKNTESVRYVKDGNKKGNVPDILRILFGMDKISEGKKKTLQNLSILQFMPVTKRIYKEIAFHEISGNLDDFNELAEDGWIKEVFVSENDVSYYELHPLINALVKEDLVPSFATCTEVFRGLEEKSDILFKSKSSERIMTDFIRSLDLQNKANYNYLAMRERKILKTDLALNTGICSSAALNAVCETVKEILFSKSTFDEDDVILSAGLMGIKKVADNMNFASYLADKCFESAEKKLVSAETAKIFTKKFIRAATYEMNLLSSNRAKAYNTYSKYERECGKYLSLKEKLLLRKKLSNVKSFLETKVKKYGDIYKCAEEARNAGNIEKSFELAESFWRIMDIAEFFRENVFMVYLKENSTQEETKYIFDAIIKHYGNRDMSDEYGIDYRFEIVSAFMQSYVARGLRHLSYEQCFELVKQLDPYPDEYPHYWKLAAKIMCGDDELIEKELYELLSKDTTVQKSPKEAQKSFEVISSALARYNKLCGLDRYAEDIFVYLDELKELSGENTSFTETVYLAHKESVKWFRGFEYTEKARKKYESCKLYVKKLGLQLDE